MYILRGVLLAAFSALSSKFMQTFTQCSYSLMLLATEQLHWSGLGFKKLPQGHHSGLLREPGVLLIHFPDLDIFEIICPEISHRKFKYKQ